MDELNKKLLRFWFHENVDTKMNNYSLLRSRTFWTLLLMFAGDVLSVYGNLLSPNLLLLFNAVLTSVASYFHLSTAKAGNVSN